jgi:hypothetical protein
LENIRKNLGFNLISYKKSRISSEIDSNGEKIIVGLSSSPGFNFLSLLPESGNPNEIQPESVQRHGTNRNTLSLS